MHDEYEKECPKGFVMPKEIQYISEYVKEKDKQYWYFLQWKNLGEMMKQEYPTFPEEAFMTT
jgi:hypothetical protein